MIKKSYPEFKHYENGVINMYISFGSPQDGFSPLSIFLWYILSVKVQNINTKSAEQHVSVFMCISTGFIFYL